MNKPHQNLVKQFLGNKVALQHDWGTRGTTTTPMRMMISEDMMDKLRELGDNDESCAHRVNVMLRRSVRE
jgi:hypothetical protein